MDYFFFFFFSSRRRHTRSKRDWSSDVCSSDLMEHDRRAGCRSGSSPAGRAPWPGDTRPSRGAHPPHGGSSRRGRSEERRVGKECRSGGGRENEKEKKRKKECTTGVHEDYRTTK